MSKQTNTHKLSDHTHPTSRLTLRIRQPGWHPDGIDVGKVRQNLFLEEAVGGKRDKETDPFIVSAFSAQFEEGSDNSTWILGTALPEPAPGESAFTLLLNDLARLARRYNAALYTLRRLKFHFELHGGLHNFPKKNDHSRDKDLTGLTKAQIGDLIPEAEEDWIAKADEINAFLDGNAHDFAIKAADMIEVNNYIVSMRVVVLKTGGELVGSSSQVSVSSAFSSSNP